MKLTNTVSQAWQFTQGLLLNVALGAIVFVAIWLLARLTRNLVSRALRRRSLRTDAAVVASRAIYVGLISVGVVMFVAVALGSALVGVTGVLLAAALTSMGLQDLVKNYISGFYVLMEKHVRVGDLVESGGYRGVVTDVRMRVTFLRGAHGEMIVVPNGELFNRTLVVSQAPPDWDSGPEGAEHDPDQSVEVVAH